jgi:peroxiredoxin Q/BCP
VTGAGDGVVNEGDEAPDFELEDQDGQLVRLSSLRGQTVVLYFYPKAGSPGCTKQACAIRDRHADFGVAGATVLGVSADAPAKLRRFADKHGLPFTLLADSEHAVAEAYDVWVQKSIFGRKSWGTQRTTFVIGPEGVIERVLRKVSPRAHDELVLSALG